MYGIRQLERIEVRPGEFFDRVTILQIKLVKLQHDEAKMKVLRKEIGQLRMDGAEYFTRWSIDDRLDLLIRELKAVNERLWLIEDRIRALDSDVFPFDLTRLQDAGDEHYEERVMDYLSTARSVYKTNDERSALKRQIDEHWGVSTEVKEYAEHG